MNRVLIVHTSWYEKHITRMLDISVEILEKHYKCDKAKAPGAIELSALAKYKFKRLKKVKKRLLSSNTGSSACPLIV